MRYVNRIMVGLSCAHVCPARPSWAMSLLGASIRRLANVVGINGVSDSATNLREEGSLSDVIRLNRDSGADALNQVPLFRWRRSAQELARHLQPFNYQLSTLSSNDSCTRRYAAVNLCSRWPPHPGFSCHLVSCLLWFALQLISSRALAIEWLVNTGCKGS